MQTIQAYKTTDGKIFERYNEANDHQFDIVGKALDYLIPDHPDGRITRADRHRIMLEMLANEFLIDRVLALSNALEGVDIRMLNSKAKDQIRYIKGEPS